MLQHISRTVGSAMAALCLVSTLAVAQAPYPTQPQFPSQPMAPQTGNTTPLQGHRQDANPMRLTCTRDDGKGSCVAALGPDGKEFVVVGEGLKSGASMSCVDKGTVVECKPAS
jgi:hypothetical protein